MSNIGLIKHSHLTKVDFWRGRDGKKYYRPLLDRNKPSLHVFTKHQDAIDHRKRVHLRYARLKASKGGE